MKLIAAVMLAVVCIAVPAAFGRSSARCSMPGSWPHTVDANWLARALTKAGFSSGSCTGSAFIVDLGAVAFTGQIYVWATQGPAVTHVRGPLGFGQIKSIRIASIIVRYDRLRGLWRAKGHNVWVQTASNQPLLPVRRWRRIVRATLVTPG
jgi:hypothetical protein